MKIKLRYRDNNYFNENNIFIFYDKPLKKIFTSKCIFHRGFYYTVKNLQFKCNSIKAQKLEC